MKTISRTEFFEAPPEVVFPILDDLGVTGTHMTNSSTMMMGSKLHLAYLTPHRTGLHSSYRWTGKMMGMAMDFTVKVTRWENGKSKVWETVGPVQLIIYSWYRMTLQLTRQGAGTLAELSISYKKPNGFFNRVLCFLFADLYCGWCLRKMLGDGKQTLAREKTAAAITKHRPAVDAGS